VSAEGDPAVGPVLKFRPETKDEESGAKMVCRKGLDAGQSRRFCNSVPAPHRGV